MFFRYLQLFQTFADVEVLVPYSTGKSDYAKQEFMDKFNVQFHSIRDNTLKYYGTKEMLRSYLILTWLLQRENDYDIVVFHDYRGIATHTIQMKESGMALQNMKLVVTCHSSSRYSDLMNQRMPSKNDLVTYGMEDYTRTYADLTIFPSQWFGDLMQTESEMNDKFRNVHVINNFIYGLNTPTSAVIDTSTVIKSKKFAYFGRVDLLKGYDFILDVVGKIGSNLIDEFLIMGDINSQEVKNNVNTLMNVMRSNNINTTLIGAKATKEAMTFLKENNYVVILASLFETFSCALQELVFAGIPVLFSNAGGSKEVVKDPFNMYEIKDKKQLTSLLMDGLQNGFRQMELASPMKTILADVQQVLLAPISDQEKKVTVKDFVDCSDVTIGILTKNRDEMVVKLINNFIDHQTCKHFQILVINNNNKMLEPLNSLSQVTQQLEDDMAVGLARRTMFQKATTTYVMLFDDDDLPNPTILEYLKTTIINTNAMLASGACRNVDQNDKYDHISLTAGFTGIGSNLLIHHSGKAAALVNREFANSFGLTITETPIEEKSPFIGKYYTCFLDNLFLLFLFFLVFSSANLFFILFYFFLYYFQIGVCTLK